MKKDFKCINNFKRQTAFTLAEVLITLGIIGVVAAMTMPMLIAKYQKYVLANKFKQSLAILTQGFQKMMVDEGVTNIDDATIIASRCICYPNSTPCLNIMKNIFQIIEEGPLYGKSAGCSGDEYYARNVGLAHLNFKRGCAYKLKEAGSMEFYSTYYSDSNSWRTNEKGMLTTFNSGSSGNVKRFILRNGMNIYFPNTYFSVMKYFLIDTNGYKKGPNTLGRDIFFVEFLSNGQIVPRGGMTESTLEYYKSQETSTLEKSINNREKNYNYYKSRYDDAVANFNNNIENNINNSYPDWDYFVKNGYKEPNCYDDEWEPSNDCAREWNNYDWNGPEPTCEDDIWTPLNDCAREWDNLDTLYDKIIAKYREEERQQIYEKAKKYYEDDIAKKKKDMDNVKAGLDAEKNKLENIDEYVYSKYGYGACKNGTNMSRCGAYMYYESNFKMDY